MSTPHLAFPFKVEGASAAVVAQDSLNEIEQNLKVLVLTERGERLEVPEFGIYDPTFQVDYEPKLISESAQRWDNRARVLSVSQISDMVQSVRIHVEENG